MGVRLAYLGPQGTNSEEAARLYVTERRLWQDGVELIPCVGLPEILAAVMEDRATAGVLPLENSIEGSIALTLDMMAHEVDLLVQGEVVVPVRHYLLAPPGVGREEITAVLSHPQALAQCRKSLQRLFPGVQLLNAPSTADAARTVAASVGNGAHTAVVATRLAAGLYGLDVLAEDIQDAPGNATRFIIVGAQDSPPTGQDKTSIVVGMERDRPGFLHDILGEFARRQINLTRIESRPAKRALGEYLFFIDLEGHRLEQDVIGALKGVKAKSGLFKVLGSYPAWRKDATAG